MCKCVRFSQEQTGKHKFCNDQIDLISFIRQNTPSFVQNSYIFDLKVCSTQDVLVYLSLYVTTMFLIMSMTKAYLYRLFQVI